MNIRASFNAGLIFSAAILSGCDQRTDFDACVEYWEQRANDKYTITEKVEVLTQIYVESNCKLSK